MSALLGKPRQGSLTDLTIRAERWLGASADHLLTVRFVSGAIAEALNWPREAVRSIRLAAMMHDIGFASIPWSGQEIESRCDVPSGLQEEHTVIGAELLSGSQSQTLNMASVIALAHHEHWDGGGYPHALRGSAIPEPARIVAVADAVDQALASDPGNPPERVIEQLCRESGTVYDAYIMELVVSQPDIITCGPRFAGGRPRSGSDRRQSRFNPLRGRRRWSHVIKRFRQHHPRLVTGFWSSDLHREPNRVY